MKSHAPSLLELETFLAVADAGSFQAAGRRLGTTQPTISSRIMQLEESLGVRVFNRTTRSCSLTARGHALVSHATQVLEAARELRLNVGNVESIAGPVRIGVVETIALTWLPALLSEIAKTLPAIDLRVEVDLSERLLQRLDANEIDVACVVTRSFNDDYVVQPLANGRLGCFVSTSSVSNETAITRMGLKDLPLIAHVLGQRGLHRWVRRSAGPHRRIIVCSSLAANIRLAMAGVGLAVLPFDIAAEEVTRGNLREVPLSPALLPNNSFVIVRRSGIADASLTAVIDLTRRLAKRETSGRPHTSRKARVSARRR